MPPFDPFQFNLVLVNYLALALLLPVVLWRKRGQVFEGLGLAEGVGFAAVAVMWWLEQGRRELVFIHENGHGYLLLEQMVDPAADLHVYGSGYVALFHPLFKLFPPYAELFMYSINLLSLVGVLALGLVVARLFSPPAGILSALALALSSSHQIHGASESRFVVAMTFFMLALWLALETRRTARIDVAIACALAAAPAGQMRPELIFLPALVVLAAFLPSLLSSRSLMGGKAGPGDQLELEDQPGLENQPELDNQPELGERTSLEDQLSLGALSGLEGQATPGAQAALEARSGSQKRRALGAAWLVAVLVLLLTAGHLRWMWLLHTSMPLSRLDELLGVGRGFWNNLLHGPILLDPSIIPRLYLPLAALAVWAGFRSGKTALLYCLALLAIFLVLYTNASVGLRERERFILPAQTVLMFLVGPGAWALALWLQKHSGLRHLAPALAAILVLVSPIPADPEYRLLSSWEFSQQRAALKEAPKGCLLFTQLPSERRALPTLSPSEIKHRLQVLQLFSINRNESPKSMQALKAAITEGSQCALYLRTSACFAIEPGDRQGADMAGPCADFEAEVTMEPVSVADIEMSRFGPQIFDYPEYIEIGFFKITGLAGSGGEEQAPERVEEAGHRVSQ